MQAQAAIQAAEAAVEQAQLNLGFTKVRSLVDGIAGIATTQMGNLVSPATVLTTVSKVDPIKVYFPISEQEYLQFTSKLLKKTSSSDLLRASETRALELILSDGSTYPHKGQVIFTDRQVDPQTGTIRVVGAFPNPGNILRPGQFGRVRALAGRTPGSGSRSATLRDGTAGNLRSGRRGRAEHHFRPEGEGRRSRGFVVGHQRGLGVRAKQVVSDGTSKVRDGMPVKPTVETPQPEGNR